MRLVAEIPAEPHVRQAQLYLRSARLALERPMNNQVEIEDALRSCEHFMAAARNVLQPPPPPPQQGQCGTECVDGQRCERLCQPCVERPGWWKLGVGS